MNVCLGIILKNEEPMLKRHLSLVSFCFDGAIFLDDGSTDRSIEIIESECRCPYDIIKREGDFIGFADKRNEVIKRAEELGYDVMFMLDADECMFQIDIDAIKILSETTEVIALPRYEFTIDFKHYSRHLYPDYQARVFQLNKGYHYRNPIHEILYKNDENASISEQSKLLYIPERHIYHYGRCKDRKFLWSKDNDYNRISQGLKPIYAEAGDADIGKDIFTETSEEFIGEQPI
jgi:glycosyltransferase involved in cell wall biosynthesis